MAKPLAKDTDGKGIPTQKGNPPYKFRLGHDPKEADRRKKNIEAFWDVWSKENETWNDWSLAIAKCLAKGAPVDLLELGVRNPFEFADLQEKYPMVVFAVYPELQADLELFAADADKEAIRYRKVSKSNITLYQAWDAWCKWMPTQAKHREPGTNHIKPSAKRLIRYIKLLKKHHADMLLSDYGARQIDDMLNHWEGRPLVESGEIAAVDTAKDAIKTIRRFNRWLHRSELPWQMPDYDDERRHVQETDAEIAAKGPNQVKTFKIAEIKILWEHARPLQRLLLLLGLNCGFGRAEVGSLYTTEIVDGFIKRVRRKTHVYGEWILWEETKKAIEWYRKRRPKSECPEFLVSKTGRPYKETSKAGNQRTDLSNLWYDLLDTVAADNAVENHEDYAKANRKEKKPKGSRRLPFNKLRKTAGNWVRRIANGEVMKVFHARGKPVQGDVHSERYSDKPFRKVFKAIKVIGAKLDFLNADWPDKVPNASKSGGGL